MAFSYVTGTAADIPAWFAAFETFVTQIGWTVMSGAGTDNIIIRSLGEEGNYTMLWAHIRNLAGVIRFDVRDDQAGTHVTTSGAAYTPNLNFDYYMNGDLEFINVIIQRADLAWRYGAFGCLWEFALDLPDETYKMVALGQVTAGTILHQYTGAWDVNITFYDAPEATGLRVHPQDGSLTFMGLYCNRDDRNAGQVPHVSGECSNTVAAGTVVTTEDESGETEWLVVQETGARRFIMRTGGDLPAGTPEGRFVYEFMESYTQDAFINTDLPAFMTGVGWTDLGPAGLYTHSRLFYSRGETGADDIYIIVAWENAANDLLHVFVQNDAVGTHRTTPATMTLENYYFPIAMHMVGDRDCLLMLLNSMSADDVLWWAGKLIPGQPGLDCAFHMATCCPLGGDYRLLRDCDGNWAQAYTMIVGNAETQPSSPNLFDDLTYVLWPIWARDARAAGGNVMVGQFQYLYHLNSTYGYARGDTVPVEDRDYKVFNAGAFPWYAIRVQ